MMRRRNFVNVGDVVVAVVVAAVVVVSPCEGLECGFPGVPLNGSINGAASMVYYPGETVTYSCQSSFVLFGPSVRNCSENGTWSQTIPECKQNLALLKPALQSSTLWNYDSKLAVDGDPNSCSFTTRSSEQRWWQVQLGVSIVVQSVVITITPGSFQRFTIFIIELLEGNKAMYKPCSKFSGNFDAKKAVFLCNDGLGHNGQFVYIRDEREEPEYLGLCEVEVFQLQNETQCGDPEQPVSSVVSRTSDNSVDYSCVKGFRLEGGNKTRQCTKSGFWSGQAPRCVEVQCNDPQSVKDGFIEVSNFKGKYVFGSLATYHCNPGFILWGNASRLCAETGDWTGIRPQCQPITCGPPPDVANARYDLINGTTSWKSFVTYACKPGFKMIFQNRNLTEISTFCTESGMWLPLSFTCMFDPLAVNLKQGSKLFGELSVLGENGFINFGTLATIGVLATLILLVLIVVIMFFNQRRKSDVGERKISRSSTNQLIADVANGLAAHFEGPNPPQPDDKVDSATTFIGPDSHGYQHPESVPFTNNHNNCLIQMTASPTRYSAAQGSIVDIKDWNLLEHNNGQQQQQHLGVYYGGTLPGHRQESSKSCQTIERSAGDGDSSNGDKTQRNSNHSDEDNSFLLARRPDGKTDDVIYSTLRETGQMTMTGDYGDGSTGTVQSNPSDPNLIDIHGDRYIVTESGLVNPDQLMSLYAQVDKNRSVAKQHLQNGHQSPRGECVFSPLKKVSSGQQTATLGGRAAPNVYANINAFPDPALKQELRDNIRLNESPSKKYFDDSDMMSASTTPRHRLYRPTTLHYNTYKPPSSRPAYQPSENNYATISGNAKRLMPHLKSANV